jgi:hypothetical protein
MRAQPARNEARARDARLRSSRALFFAAGCSCAALTTLVAACGSASSNGGLGQGHFAYVCPTAVAGQPNPDAFCEATADVPIPDVAVGAAFRLSYTSSGTGGPQPAVASLAQSVADGWVLLQPGWLGFVAWSGSDVADFTHVHGQPVASLRWQADPSALPLAVGETTNVAIVPVGADGSTLGGQMGCTFAASDPSVASVVASGRSAVLTAVAPGTATLEASCLGATLSAVVRVTSSGATMESGVVDEGGD